MHLDEEDGPKAGFMPGEGHIFVTVMNGMVAGNLYQSDDKASSTEYNFYNKYLSKNKTETFESDKNVTLTINEKRSSIIIEYSK